MHWTCSEISLTKCGCQCSKLIGVRDAAISARQREPGRKMLREIHNLGNEPKKETGEKKGSRNFPRLEPEFRVFTSGGLLNTSPREAAKAIFTAGQWHGQQRAYTASGILVRPPQWRLR
jgi:hypothetical protein